MDKESSCKLCWIRWWVLQRGKGVSTGLSISPCSRWCLWPRSKLQIWHGCLFWMEYYGWSNCSWRYRNRRLRPFIQMGLWTNSSSLECLFKHQDFLITWKYKLDNKKKHIWIKKFFEIHESYLGMGLTNISKSTIFRMKANSINLSLNEKQKNRPDGRMLLLITDDQVELGKWTFLYQITTFFFFQHYP